MSTKFKNRNSDPKRWDSADPDTITALAAASITIDLAAMQDWFGYCRFKYPSIFRGWTIEQFKNWNDERIAALDREYPPQTYDEALAEIKGNCLKRIDG